MKSFYTVSLSQILLRSPHKNYLGFIRAYYKKKFEKLFILPKEKALASPYYTRPPCQWRYSLTFYRTARCTLRSHIAAYQLPEKKSKKSWQQNTMKHHRFPIFSI